MTDLTADSLAGLVELPSKTFFYTFDQIAYILSMDEGYLRKKLTHFIGRDYGQGHPSLLKAYNLAAVEDMPQWRIPEEELTRWLRIRGVRWKAAKRVHAR